MTNNIFVTTHEENPSPPCTDQWDLISVQNIGIGSFLRPLKYTNLCEYQVVKLYDFHNDLSITLSASVHTNIEFLPLLLNLYISIPFHVLLVNPIYHRLQPACL